ncbi:CHAT domain-containing protein [Chloroflexales bacterium ZM16-3]|nr:CHAT domain-containing protein [Chloroflexales bacterium ZM16-3]
MTPPAVELKLTIVAREGDIYDITADYYESPGYEGRRLATNEQVIISHQDLLAVQSVPIEYGRVLSQAIFGNTKLRSAWDKAYTSAQVKGAHFCLLIHIDTTPGLLHRVQWETITFPEQSSVSYGTNPLAVDERVSIIRVVKSDNLHKNSSGKDRHHRALVVISSPKDRNNRYNLAHIDIYGEVRRVKESFHNIDLEIIAYEDGDNDLNSHASLAVITNRLRQKSTILYIVAHGQERNGQASLCLEDKDGAPHWINAQDITHVIAGAPHPPKIVILVACESAGQLDPYPAEAGMTLGSQLANAGIPAVIAFQGKPPIVEAQPPIRSLLRSLSNGKTIEEAVAASRRTMWESASWHQMVFYRSSRIGPLFSMPSRTKKPVPSDTADPDVPHLDLTSILDYLKPLAVAIQRRGALSETEIQRLLDPQATLSATALGLLAQIAGVLADVHTTYDLAQTEIALCKLMELQLPEASARLAIQIVKPPNNNVRLTVEPLHLSAPHLSAGQPTVLRLTVFGSITGWNCDLVGVTLAAEDLDAQETVLIVSLSGQNSGIILHGSIEIMGPSGHCEVDLFAEWHAPQPPALRLMYGSEIHSVEELLLLCREQPQEVSNWIQLEAVEGWLRTIDQYDLADRVIRLSGASRNTLAERLEMVLTGIDIGACYTVRDVPTPSRPLKLALNSQAWHGDVDPIFYQDQARLIQDYITDDLPVGGSRPLLIYGYGNVGGSYLADWATRQVSRDMACKADYGTSVVYIKVRLGFDQEHDFWFDSQKWRLQIEGRPVYDQLYQQYQNLRKASFVASSQNITFDDEYTSVETRGYIGPVRVEIDDLEQLTNRDISPSQAYTRVIRELSQRIPMQSNDLAELDEIHMKLLETQWKRSSTANRLPPKYTSRLNQLCRTYLNNSLPECIHQIRPSSADWLMQLLVQFAYRTPYSEHHLFVDLMHSAGLPRRVVILIDNVNSLTQLRRIPQLLQPNSAVRLIIAIDRGAYDTWCLNPSNHEWLDKHTHAVAFPPQWNDVPRQLSAAFIDLPSRWSKDARIINLLDALELLCCGEVGALRHHLSGLAPEGNELLLDRPQLKRHAELARLKQAIIQFEKEITSNTQEARLNTDQIRRLLYQAALIIDQCRSTGISHWEIMRQLRHKHAHLWVNADLDQIEALVETMLAYLVREEVLNLTDWKE